MRISPVGYYPSYINTAMYIGNTARSVMNQAAIGNHDVLSPVDKVPKVYSNVETERVIKTPEEMQHDREVAMEVLKGKTPRDAANLNPHLDKVVKEMQEEQLHMETEAGKVHSDESMGDEECETCENRKYVDGSNEGNVSFKSPQKISPQSAASAVLSHEYEHVRNAMREDQKEDAELVSVSVSLKTAICPECGKTYVAGGETRTTMRYTSGGGETAQQPEVASGDMQAA
ncbi:MAG: hypothetical protein IJY10_06600 [Lachnospiraceae bacterium]|nr:hypothetical protein [Lachnospiraceae bacterium]MBQ9123145.1 hypothetical protein [Lachnospiraceae bacterium]